MPKLDDFFDEIDSARVRRAKELSEIKRSFDQLAPDDVYGVASKAVVVLAYANWEGFYNECVRAYLEILPHTLKHPTLVEFDYVKFQQYYQQRYAGAMYSGCGGGYIYVASDEPVPGGFKPQIRYEKAPALQKAAAR
jgi:hypothetical protein